MIDELEYRSKMQYTPDILGPRVDLDHLLAGIICVI